MSWRLTRRASRPKAISRPGQKNARYGPLPQRELTRSGPAGDDQPDAQQDEQHRPHDVEAQPEEQVEVVEQEVDPDRDQDEGPEVVVSPGHRGPILGPGPGQTGATTSNSSGLSLRAASISSAPATVAWTGRPSSRYRL